MNELDLALTPETETKQKADREKNWWDPITSLAGLLLVLGGYLGTVAMALVATAGYVEIFSACVRLLRASYSADHERHAAALDTLIQGIELLFLAPLAYIVVESIARYIDPKRGERSPLLRAKALTLSLLAAVIAADLVGKILNTELSIAIAAPELLVLAVLSAYSLAVERFGKSMPVAANDKQ